MDQLLLQLRDQKGAGLYQTPVVNPAELADACQTAGIQFFHLDGSQISNKAELLGHAAQAMGFPDYFGHNWDALEDCLTDLQGEKESGYLILFSQADRLATLAPEQWQILLDILRSAIKTWQTANTPLYVLLQSSVDLTNLAIL